MIKAVYAGRDYEIPEIWLIGFQVGSPGATMYEAVAYWALQKDLEAREAS